jgi:mutator protein MutT
MSTITPKPQSLSLKALLLDTEGRCLLLRRSAASKDNAGKWEMPGGKIDPDESFDVALAREVREETGLTIRLIRPFETAMSDLPDRQVVYLVMLAQAEPGKVRLSEEHDEFQWVAPSDLEDIDFSPQFRGVGRHFKQFIESQQPPAPPRPPEALVTPEKLDGFLKDFVRALPKHKQLKDFLIGVLETAIKPQFPLATIGGRAKGLVSFADKTVKKNKYTDPVHQQTDLAGLRVVVHLPSEVEAVERIIREIFHIDEANSLDMLSRLGPDKFGYRSVHYIVQIIKNKPAGVKIPPGLMGLKAEIQVRTIAQHAWSDIGHDRLYKGACEISDYWKREANRVAALLEAADEEFQRLVEGISFYEAHQPRCADSDSARKCIELTRVIRRHVPKDLDLALRHARLAAEIEDWQEVVQVAKDKNIDTSKKPMIMALGGYAMYKLARNDAKRKAAWQKMEEAAQISPRIAEPRLLLADSLAEQRRNLGALKHYLKAFEAEPGNPAALSGVIRQKALTARDPEFVSIARPAIQTAIRRCGELAAAQADLPRARYRIAGFLQLLGADKEWESLATFAQAVRETRSPDALVSALCDASLLAGYEPHRQDLECALRFLAAALRSRFLEIPMPENVTFPAAKPIQHNGPFVIVAGGCDPCIELNMETYRELLHAAFADFEGVVISGGTEQGVSGLVGEIAQKSKGRIHAIGYLPPQLPTDNTATRDDRYKELRKTDSKRFFSPTEAVQVWLDLLATGVTPADVRLLGINGGLIAGLEYRFALALGARVGLLKNSGREAERLIQDWPPDRTPNLFVLPKDPMTVRAFLHFGVGDSTTLSPKIVMTAARQIHEDFLDQQRYSHPDPVMQPWAKLREDLREFNRNQIEYLEDILRANNFAIRPAGLPPNNPAFTKKEIERMAEMEHGRWVLERIASGWTYGREKSVKNRISPYIVSWENLPESVRKYDREAVHLWPELLAKAELEIFRLPRKARATKKRGRKSGK